MCAGAVKGLPRALPLPPCLSARMLIQLLRIRPPHPAHARSSSNITCQRFGAPHSQPPSLPPPQHPAISKKLRLVIQGVWGSSRKISRALCSTIQIFAHQPNGDAVLHHFIRCTARQSMHIILQLDRPSRSTRATAIKSTTHAHARVRASHTHTQ